jgi:hypothetical protein
LQQILANAHEVRVLVVHGMAPHDTGYSVDLQRRIADALNLVPDTATLFMPIRPQPISLSGCARLRSFVDPYGDPT